MSPAHAQSCPEDDWHGQYADWREDNPALINNTNLQTLVSCYYTFQVHAGKGYPVLFNDFHARFYKDHDGRIFHLAVTNALGTNAPADYEIWEMIGQRH